MQGYIKDHRKELNSDIWQMPPLYHRVWQWLKYQVNHNDVEIPMADGTKLMIRKGQHLTSVRKIARGVGYYQKGVWEEPNPKSINHILSWMVKSNMITISRGKDNRQYTLITVLNWDTYQMLEEQKPEEPKAPKDRKQKPDKYPEGSPFHNMAKYFYKKVSDVAAQEGLSHLIIKADLQKWADEMRKLVEIDKQDKHLVKAVMDWIPTDSFWKTNVLSAKKLREKFPDLALKMNSGKAPRAPAPQKDFRDKEIEFQRWVQEGKDPNEFNWGK